MQDSYTLNSHQENYINILSNRHGMKLAANGGEEAENMVEDETSSRQSALPLVALGESHNVILAAQSKNAIALARLV